MTDNQEISITISINRGVININGSMYTPLQSMKILGDMLFGIAKKQQLDYLFSTALKKGYNIKPSHDRMIHDRSIRMSYQLEKEDVTTIYVDSTTPITIKYKTTMFSVECGSVKFNSKQSNINNLEKIVKGLT
jgi:hypothetical protein